MIKTLSNLFIVHRDITHIYPHDVLAVLHVISHARLRHNKIKLQRWVFL